jgi:polysaccharide chain length determinant protein (PEP-CTERM system associated)
VIPGKQYSPEQILATVRARKWLLVGGLVAGLTGGSVVGRALPEWYRSETVILVVPQRVPENIIRSIVTARLEDRVKSISQEILGHGRLQRVIEEFNLYPELRAERGMEAAIAQARVDVKVEFVKNDQFAVSYRSRDPRTAQRVTERLAADFIEQNLKERVDVADATNVFLDSQLQSALQRLVEKERQLEQYRLQYAGELPTQVPANQQVLQSKQMQVQAVVDSISRDRDRRLVVQRELADLQAATPASEPVSDGARAPVVAEESEVAAALAAAERELRDLQSRYTAQHPDVAAARRRVRELQQKAAAEVRLAGAPGITAAPAGVSAAERARQNRRRQLGSEIENIDQQIAAKQLEERRLRGEMAELQGRIDAAPTRETELVALTRDYETLQQIYVNLLARKEDSKISANLEKRQIGEQFRILDPARVPEKPYSPDRERLLAIGAVAGLALAGLLVAWLEYRDATLKTEEEILSCVGLPVIAVIPVMTRTIEPPRSRLRRLVPWSATAAVTTAANAVRQIFG